MTNLERYFLIDATGKQENVLDVIEPVAMMDTWEQAKRAKKMLSEKIGSVYYIYDADSSNLCRTARGEREVACASGN